MMQYDDPVYGSTEIVEPVLLDLMQAATVQRLQGVLQHGITGLIGITRPATRFEHSVGAMLLVRRLGGSLEEQVAALLHDVSHTAFSHVIDYVFGNHDNQSYHEEKKAEYMAGTDLPAVLARNGYDWQAFLHEEDYPLLEQPAPALCADRLDYFMRDSLDLGLATLEQIRFVLDHLVVHPDTRRIVVNDLPAARWLGYTFIQADQASWANFREVALYELAARAIRTGLELGAIGEDDLWRTDRLLWDRLHEWDDPVLRRQLALVSPGTQFAWDEESPTFWVSTKLRTVDPDVLVDGGVQLLSALDVDFARHRAGYVSGKAGKWPVRVLSPELQVVDKVGEV